MTPELAAVPRLCGGVRLSDEPHQAAMLLLPERAFRLNSSSLEIVRLCDGKHTVQEIAEILGNKYSKTERSIITKDLLTYLVQLHEARAIDF